MVIVESVGDATDTVAGSEGCWLSVVGFGLLAFGLLYYNTHNPKSTTYNHLPPSFH